MACARPIAPAHPVLGSLPRYFSSAAGWHGAGELCPVHFSRSRAAGGVQPRPYAGGELADDEPRNFAEHDIPAELVPLREARADTRRARNRPCCDSTVRSRSRKGSMDLDIDSGVFNADADAPRWLRLDSLPGEPCV